MTTQLKGKQLWIGLVEVRTLKGTRVLTDAKGSRRRLPKGLLSEAIESLLSGEVRLEDYDGPIEEGRGHVRPAVGT